MCLIKIVYLGTARLLLNKREETLTFLSEPTAAQIGDKIACKYGSAIAKECRNKLWIVDIPGHHRPRYVRDISQVTAVIPDRSTVTIVSRVTGG